MDIQEVYVGSPLISVVYASDGTSNLDPPTWEPLMTNQTTLDGALQFIDAQAVGLRQTALHGGKPAAHLRGGLGGRAGKLVPHAGATRGQGHQRPRRFILRIPAAVMRRQ